MLTYAQQSKEQASIEQDRLGKRIQEFRTQAEMKETVPSNLGTNTTHVSVNGVGMSGDKNIDTIMQSTTKGTVRIFLAFILFFPLKARIQTPLNLFVFVPGPDH